MFTVSNDVAEISNLVALIAHASDGGDLDAYDATFTDDASVEYPGLEPMKGKATILASFRGMYDAGMAGPKSNIRHVVSTIAVTVHGDVATAQSYAQIVTLGAPGPAMLGRYDDGFVRTGDGWRFASRVFATVASA
jgi:ketosteroid isomerase-like protein